MRPQADPSKFAHMPKGNRTENRGKGPPQEYETRFGMRITAAEMALWKRMAKKDNEPTLSAWFRKLADQRSKELLGR